MAESATPDIWTFDPIWQKSKVFMDRALEADRDGPLFPHWAALSLELLGRATLARVHPVLLADPREPENLFYALGLGVRGIPRSVPAKTVFARCQRLIDVKRCVTHDETSTGVSSGSGSGTSSA